MQPFLREWFLSANTKRNIITFISLLLIFCCAFCLCLVSTKSGPGINPDSVHFISTAEHLAQGKGYFADVSFYPLDPLDLRSDIPYTHWPPLYPTLIAILIKMGMDSINAARYCSIFFFAALVFPVFLIAYKITSSSLIAYLACILTTTLPSLVKWGSYVLTEPLYIFMSSLALLALLFFVSSSGSSPIAVLWAGIFTAAATLARYVGIALWLTGIIVLLLGRKKDPITTKIKNLSIYSVILVFPIGLWMYRNIRISQQASLHAATGGHFSMNREITLFSDLVTTIIAILGEFFHLRLGIIAAIKPFWPLLSIFIIVISILLLWKAIKFIRNTKGHDLLIFLPGYLVLMTYVVIYPATFIIAKSSVLDFGWHNRTVSPIYPFIVILGLSFVYLLYICLKKKSAGAAVLLLAFFSIYIFGQLVNTARVVEKLSKGSGYTNQAWKNDLGIAWARENIPSSSLIVSNHPDALSYFLKRPVKYLPYINDQEKTYGWFTHKGLKKYLPYVIIFKKSWRNYIIGNEEFMEMNKRYDTYVLVRDFPETAIYKFGGSDKQRVMVLPGEKY